VFIRRTIAALFTALCLLMVACTAADQGPAASTPAVEPSITMGFTQWGPLLGTNKALLRVENHSGHTMQLTGIGLDWPGFGGPFAQPKNATLAAEQILDLSIDLPEPTCTDPEAPIIGLVQLASGRDVRQQLERTAQTFVRRLWTTLCSARFVRTALQIEYADQWTERGQGTNQFIRGRLELTRRTGDQPIRLLGAQGSVLYDVTLPGPFGLPAGRSTASLPIEINPGNRCDEHAIGQVTRPFGFGLHLRIGRERRLSVSIPPPLRAQVEATALLRRVCRFRTG